MRFVNADKLIDQIKLQAGCAECNSYDGVRCRACQWDDAIAIVDGFADNPDNSIEFEDDDFQRVLDYQKESGSVSVGVGILNAISLAEDRRMIIDGIEFYVPRDEIVPTVLRLRVDNKYVEYEHKSALDYVFNFFAEWTYEEAEEATKRIAKAMEQQSDDGYSRWELIKIELCGTTSFRAKFRVRDAG